MYQMYMNVTIIIVCIYFNSDDWQIYSIEYI